MLNYDLPLTKAEADFAAEHHDLIYRYLCKAGLSEEEGYDIVVFGYLRAVRKYLARPELRQYQFSTIAYRAMSCNLHHSREYWLRQKRKGSVESYDEDIHADDLHDPGRRLRADALFPGALRQADAHPAAHRRIALRGLP